MKLKTFARRAAAAGAVLAALTLAALPALAAPKVQVSTTNAVADHADILSDETEQYVNDVSIKLSDACGAQIGVYTLDELLGSTTMEGFAYDVFNAWGLGSDDLDNGVLLLLAPNEADGGDYYIMRGDGLESQLSFSTLGSLLDEYMEPYWVNGDYDTGTQKTVQALANRLCSIYGVTLNSSYTDTSAPDKGGPNVMRFVLLVVAVLLVIWLITYLMRPRGPRPPHGGGGGSSAATPSVSDKAAKELKNAKEGSTVTIDMKGETKLPASVTKEIAGKDITVELDMGGGMVWSFNGLDVPKGGVSLDLGVKTGTKTIPTKVINALTGEATTIQLQLDHNGPFGMSLKLSVDLGKKHDGLYANLYFYNPKSSALEFRSAGMISGGKASWAFDHASDYAIVIDKESHEPMTFTDVPDTGYYAEAVNWAVAKKITGGVGNNLFAPNDPCTRAQIVTFLYRNYQSK